VRLPSVLTISSHLCIGFTPSTFVSSRGDRSKKKASRPEDFMDEEDLQELKDSRDLVDTTDEMELAGRMQGAAGGDDEDQECVHTPGILSCS
jgi:G patch domain-containing protein 1